MNPDINKLPKWAQELFAQLEREKLCAEDLLKRHVNSQTKSKILVRDSGDWENENVQYIQSDRVVFLIDGSELVVSVKKDHIEVMATGINYQLVISPNVTNIITIGTR